MNTILYLIIIVVVVVLLGILGVVMKPESSEWDFTPRFAALARTQDDWLEQVLRYKKEHPDADEWTISNMAAIHRARNHTETRDILDKLEMHGIPMTEFRTSLDRKLQAGLYAGEQDGVVGGREGYVYGQTWEQVEANPDIYFDLLARQRQAIKGVDWSPVFDALHRELQEESMEYAGLIDIRDNKAYVMTKHKGVMDDSPYAVARIPSDVAAEIRQTPAVIMYHTHPTDGESLPSSMDYMASFHDSAETGQIFLEAVIARDFITLYGPKPRPLLKLMQHRSAPLMLARKALDMFNSLIAMRSYEMYNEDTLSAILRRFGMYFAKVDRYGPVPNDRTMMVSTELAIAENKFAIQLTRDVHKLEKKYLS